MIAKNYTTVNISRLLNVTSSTVARWIDGGKLEAFVTPGGHRRVNTGNLKEFLVKHKMPLPREMGTDKKKILVVEDETDVLKAIVRILKAGKEKYRIFTATDGFHAGTLTCGCDPDLIILDIMLPGIDGFKVCELIRKQNKKIKILAITGYPTEENKKKILNSGADAFLPKPFDMKELSKNVKMLLCEK